GGPREQGQLGRLHHRPGPGVADNIERDAVDHAARVGHANADRPLGAGLDPEFGGVQEQVEPHARRIEDPLPDPGEAAAARATGGRMRATTRAGQGRVAIVAAVAVVAAVVVIAVFALRHGPATVHSLAVPSAPVSPGTSPSASATATAAPSPAGGTVIFADDFSNPSSGWAPDP